MVDEFKPEFITRKSDISEKDAVQGFNGNGKLLKISKIIF
jgi:hypothetical protein